MITNRRNWAYVVTGSTVILVIIIATLAYQLLSTPNRVQLVDDTNERKQITFFALGDQGSGKLLQWKVANGMKALAKSMANLDFTILLGDNFYSHGVTSIYDKQWNWKFENVYTGEKLSTIPFYAVLGNHDKNARAEIQYSNERAGSGRWQMPGHYYSKDFGTDNGHPLLRVVFIDTNLEEGLSRQIEFVEQAFSESAGKPTWRIVAGHHPVRNFGKHGETQKLVSNLLPVLKRSHVDVYLAGHNHIQEFIARAGEPYYIISGGGGQSLYRLPPMQKNLLFAESEEGFVRVDVDPSYITIRYYDGDAELEWKAQVSRTGQLETKSPSS